MQNSKDFSYQHPHQSLISHNAPASTSFLSQQSIVNYGYEPSADEDEDSYEKSDTERAVPVEIFRRRNRGKRRLKKNGCNLQDPLVVCGCDIMLTILSFLDAHSVASSLAVSRRWRRVACSDTIWSEKINKLWADKAHLPRFALVEGLSKLNAYTLSIQDGKRVSLFNICGRRVWRNLDPYWRGTRQPMHRYFHDDGSQTADVDDRVWGGNECCYSIVASFLADGNIRKHYVSVNSWPRLSISRRHDWGWEMSNRFYFYSSVPDAYKPEQPIILFLSCLLSIAISYAATTALPSSRLFTVAYISHLVDCILNCCFSEPQLLSLCFHGFVSEVNSNTRIGDQYERVNGGDRVKDGGKEGGVGSSMMAV
ncbi:unnamed protein product [Lactuca saligna]|uniref:F-box domain-containing protein n=1 Tax=Lactuca saligna TaxID=75948 RepID=A0AA35V1R8_LACSI|nr:unnamed protein product [Lactuca saligna]